MARTRTLAERKRDLAEVHDEDGAAIDLRDLGKNRFATGSDAGAAASLAKSRMMSPERIAYREELADVCEKTAELWAKVRPRMSKSAQATSLKTEQGLLESARQLRERR